MTLQDIVANLEQTDDALTICAEQSAESIGQSQCELQPAADVPAGCRFPYFLEVSVAKNVLRAWSFARGGRAPSLPEACDALIYYAQHDAYLLPIGKH